MDVGNRRDGGISRGDRSQAASFRCGTLAVAALQRGPCAGADDFTVLLASLGGLDHAGAVALVGHPANALALAVLVTVGLWHGTLGLQVVIEDYITISGGRTLALAAMRAAMALVGLATLWAISQVAL